MSITTVPATPAARHVPTPRSPEAPTRAAVTTPRRDLFVDTLRAFAIVLVVAQHWLMPVIGTDESGALVTGNALTTPGAWIVTWISQVMPLIFFAGGAAAIYSTRGRPPTEPAEARRWVAHRITRLAAPVLPLAAIWVPLPHLLLDAGLPAQAVEVGSRLVGGLLWFLALYAVIVAATPLLLRWYHRRPAASIGALAAAAAGTDVLRFGTGADVLGYANLVFVWCAVYLAGIAYADGRLGWLTGRVAWLVSAAGFGATAFLVAAGPYVPSMIGMPGAPMSNMNPPTVVLLTLAAAQLGLAFAVRDRIVAWASLPEVSQAIGALSKRLMTIYVWHTPALVAVAGVAVLGFGWETPEPFGPDWRTAMPIWLTALTVVLTVLTRTFGRFEAPGVTAVESGRVIPAVLLIGGGLLGLTVIGFTPAVPIAAFAFSLAIGVGAALLRFRRMPGSFSPPAQERVMP